ncbi:MAG: glycosyltransferase [Nitrospiraceae bacterium]|nr:MAG: glycosyltransferase [Nitrospiraceae bacterium]
MKSITDKPMRVAMLSIHSDPLGKLGTQDTGGMSIYIRELSRELGRAGHHVDIFTRSSGERQCDTLQIADNVRVIYLNHFRSRHIPKSMLYSYITELWTSLEIYRLRNSLLYDLVHSHYWVSGKIGTFAQKRWNVPHFLTLHTTGIIKKISCFQEMESINRLISEKRLANECDCILAPTYREKNYFIKYLQVPDDSIRLVPCGVNLDRFNPIDQEKARKVLGLPAERRLVLYVGRFAPVKGINRLLYAMGHLREEPNIGLIMVGGDGNDSVNSRAIQRMAHRMGIRDSIMLRGQVDHDELPLYYSAANMLVLPSYYESFGLVALESLACGTPVVSFNVGAMDNIIQSDLTGAIVHDPGPRTLAQAIRAVILKPVKSAFYREAIRQSVSQYGWRNSALRLIKEYERAVCEGTECRQQALVS